MLAFDTQRRIDGPADDRLALFGTPRWRATLGLEWQRGPHALRLSARHSQGFPGCMSRLDPSGNPNALCAIRVGSHSEIDAQWRGALPWAAEIAVGGRNLGNRPVPLGPSGEFAYGLHDPIGRVWYLRYQQRF